nr:methylated-DNA--[protein]-cysteine S-methyltransferase [uncultured Cetobacterium sp.]
MRYILEIDRFNILIEEEDECITRLEFTDLEKSSNIDSKVVLQLEKELKEYFQGKRKDFTVPLKMVGSEFQMRVWNELKKIKYGETKSYKEIAEGIGNPKGCRAVGNANGKNPISIIVPCHRVINENKKLGGYAGGVDIKKILLELEEKNS